MRLCRHVLRVSEFGDSRRVQHVCPDGLRVRLDTEYNLALFFAVTQESTKEASMSRVSNEDQKILVELECGGKLMQQLTQYIQPL